MTDKPDFPRDGYFAIVDPKKKPPGKSSHKRRPKNVKREDPFDREIDEVPLGTCLDVSRELTPPLSKTQLKFIADMARLIPEHDQKVAIAELECMIRGTIQDFDSTSSATIHLLRSHAKKRKIDIASKK